MDRRSFLKLMGLGAFAYFTYVNYRDFDISKRLSDYFDEISDPLEKENLKNIDSAILDFVKGINRIFKEEKEADMELENLIKLLKLKKPLSEEDFYKLNLLDYQLKLTKSGIEKVKDNKENIISSAKKWNIEPEFLAGILFVEYIDMEKGENFTDFWGSFIRDTSVGFGQVRTDTYKGYYSDSWFIQKLPRPAIAFLLRFNKLNIEAAGKYIRYLANEGNKKHNLSLLKYHSKYWDEELRLIIAASYTAKPFSERILNHKKPPFLNYHQDGTSNKEVKDQREPAAHGYEVLEAYKLIKKLSIFGITSSSPVNQVKVLLVDDTPIMLSIYERYLEKLGYLVEKADDGLEALEKIKAAIEQGDPYTFVVTDYQMPVLDGLGLLRELNKLGAKQKVPPALMLSGSPEVEEDSLN
ncbi:MAG: response regulator, partial [Candidatus Omnitrophota bacterium]